MTRPEQLHTRRQLLKGIGALVAMGAAGTGAGVAIWRAATGGNGSPSSGGRSGPFALSELAANTVSGGPGKDGIPAIDRPTFVTASDASFLRDEDPVFGIAHRGEVRAYPQVVLVWHEIVNDSFAGERVSVTYCPLTGSVVAFSGVARNGKPLTFGTTGKLVNSNLLMYDRVTDSEWPQLAAKAIRGPEKGRTLTEIPLVWSTWRRWREAHPQTAVLSTRTGFARSYGDDPYGSYVPLGGYYASGGPFFPVMAESDRLPAKKVVVGVKAGRDHMAVRKAAVERAGVLPLELGRAHRGGHRRGHECGYREVEGWTDRRGPRAEGVPRERPAHRARRHTVGRSEVQAPRVLPERPLHRLRPLHRAGGRDDRHLFRAWAACAPAESGATGRTNVFMNGVKGPGPMGFQPSVFDSDPGDPVWSPYWDHLTYAWKKGARVRVLRSERQVHAARDAGELKEFPGTPDTKGEVFTVNCPVPVTAPATFRA